MEIYEEILRLKRAGKPSALATIVECTGSTPRKAGAKMLVKEDGSVVGTLGGGYLEVEAIRKSLATIRDGSPMTIHVDLTEGGSGLACGGKVLVFVEPIVPEPRLVILGAGHVGKALSTVASFSGFRVTVVDDRSEYANEENLRDAHQIVVKDFRTVFSEVPVDRTTFVVIATRGHNHDLDALKAALCTETRYIGLLGSKRKKAVLFRTLKDEGFSEYDLERVVTPIGLQIGSVTPEEIAISIAAQLIERRRANEASRVRHSSCSWQIEEDGAAETAPPLRG